MGFSADFDRMASRALQTTDEQRRTITVSYINGVISDTPVLNGQLRGNWQATENTPATSILERKDKSGELAKAEALNMVIGTRMRDCVLYFANNLPYAYPIEFEGYSKKAPAGMVRRNLARINSIVARVTSGGRA